MTTGSTAKLKAPKTSPAPAENSNNSPDNKNSSSESQQLSAGAKSTDKTSPIDSLPLDTPTRRTAKKVLAVTGGSAAALGLYLGLRLIKNVL
ncbi:MAG: hypothetical protein HY979_03480 [Candidatus Magasanikbacteria bacterium]|nr:hypothetical protein [Candidatus Magasanikbacteria bacterium]